MLAPVVSEETKARKVLEDAGYYVGNLWQVDDVKGKWPECTDDQAQDVLDNAFANEATYGQIWMSIDYAIEAIKGE